MICCLLNPLACEPVSLMVFYPVSLLGYQPIRRLSVYKTIQWREHENNGSNDNPGQCVQPIAFGAPPVMHSRFRNAASFNGKLTVSGEFPFSYVCCE